VEGGRSAGRASDGDELEGAWGGASCHADQHGQPGVDVQESGPVGRGRVAGGASNGNEEEGARAGASRYANQHGQPGVSVKGSGAFK